MSHVANHNGLIETLTVGEYVPMFPYMDHFEPRAIIQSFSGTAATESTATVGYLGKCPDGVCLALAGGDGWSGMRRDGSRSKGMSLYHALFWAAALPFTDDDHALGSIIAFRNK